MESISKIQFQEDGPIYTFKDAYVREQLSPESDHILNLANAKNSIARGKDITEYFTDGTLYTRISNGTFEDLFVGDYFTASYNGTDINFRIAGFNTYLHNGSTELTSNHVVIVPDTKLTTGYMNRTDATTGGYVGSYMYNTIIGSVATSGSTSTVNGNLYNIFGSHLLSHYLYLNSTVTNGVTSNWSNVQVQAVLMSETELYGCKVVGCGGFEVGNSLQFPLFRLIPQYKQYERYPFWLRNVASSTFFAACATYGNVGYNSASDTDGVRPCFLIG